MKKVVLIIIAISVVACNKTAEVKEVKTAYVDTSILMREYTEAKDLEAKYKAQSSERKTTRSRDQSFPRCIKLSGASASQWARGRKTWS
jgi:Ni/Co efflux regulator RcnB